MLVSSISQRFCKGKAPSQHCDLALFFFDPIKSSKIHLNSGKISAFLKIGFYHHKIIKAFNEHALHLGRLKGLTFNFQSLGLRNLLTGL